MSVKLRDFAIARLRNLLVLIVFVLLIGCGASGSDVAEAPAPAPQVQTPPAPDPRVAEMQVLLAELLDRIEVLNARLQRLEAGAPPTPAAVPTRPQATPATADSRSVTGAALAENYRAALTLYGKGQLDRARKLFQEVFDADPNGELADNALYWIAETYFVTAKYSEAMNLYRRILKDYSEENKAPDAMLKMGLTYVKLGDLGLARTTFEQLIQKYPYSTPAATAKVEIKRIKY